MSPEEAREICARAERGDAEALAMTAMFAALGAFEPQDWRSAAARLALAAEAGSPTAAGQLRVLADGRDAPYADLAQAIDWTAWLASPAKSRISADPRIAVSSGFLPTLACRWVVERARGRFSQAMVFEPASGGVRGEPGRTNSAFSFAFEDMDVVMAAIRARIAAAVSVPAGALEPAQVLHYAPGQQFDRHFDFLDPSVAGFAAEIERGGQRSASFLVYLNSGFEGGETDFPHLSIRYKGAAGDALMFSNVDAAGAPDRRTLHAGLPPTSGEKWLLSQWIRDRATG